MSRFEKIAAKLSQYDLDAMMITSAPNRLYATSFPSSAGLALVTKNGSYFFTDSRYFDAHTPKNSLTANAEATKQTASAISAAGTA